MSSAMAVPRQAARILVRVRYAETDQMGVVYYANYFVWFEIGRTELLRTLGWTYREMEASGYALPVITASCEYHRPARYDTGRTPNAFSIVSVNPPSFARRSACGRLPA